MNNIWNKILFSDRPLWVRIWIISGILCAAFYIAKSSFFPAKAQTELDMYIATFGLGSIALYVLIYGFDWKK